MLIGQRIVFHHLRDEAGNLVQARFYHIPAVFQVLDEEGILEEELVVALAAAVAVSVFEGAAAHPDEPSFRGVSVREVEGGGHVVVVIAQREIEVPYHGHEELGVGVFGEVGGQAHAAVHVLGELVHDVVVDERLHFHHGTVSALGIEVAGIEQALHLVHIGGDVLFLGLVGGFRILEFDFLVEYGRAEVLVKVLLVVNLEEIAAVRLAGRHHGDGDLAVAVHFLGFHQQVAAAVLPVEIHLRAAVFGRPGHGDHPAHPERQGVTQERGILHIGQQIPVAVLFHAEHLAGLFGAPVGIGELEAVGVLDAALGIVGGITASADAHGKHLGIRLVLLGVLRLVHALGVPEAHRAVHVGIFAFGQPLGLLGPGDVDAGEIGQRRDFVVAGVVGEVGPAVQPARLGLVRIRLCGLGHGDGAAGLEAAVQCCHGDGGAARPDGFHHPARDGGHGRGGSAPVHLFLVGILRGNRGGEHEALSHQHVGRFPVQAHARDGNGGGDRRFHEDAAVGFPAAGGAGIDDGAAGGQALHHALGVHGSHRGVGAAPGDAFVGGVLRLEAGVELEAVIHVDNDVVAVQFDAFHHDVGPLDLFPGAAN